MEIKINFKINFTQEGKTIFEEKFGSTMQSTVHSYYFDDIVRLSTVGDGRVIKDLHYVTDITINIQKGQIATPLFAPLSLSINDLSQSRASP